MKRLFAAAVLLLGTAALSHNHECELVGNAFFAFDDSIRYHLIGEVHGDNVTIDTALTQWIMTFRPIDSRPANFVIFNDGEVIVGRGAAMVAESGEIRVSFKNKGGTFACWFEGILPTVAPMNFG